MKKILFTGGTSGIAYHTILRLVQKDFYIYVTSHTEEETMRMKKRFSAYSNVECFVLDVMSDEDIMKLKQLDVDVLVSSAAIGEGGALMEVPISLMEKNFRVNVFQNLKVIQTVLSRMVQKGEGRIIIMSSLAGILPVPFLGSYCATKASLISLAEILRLELQLLRKNIDVILIEPGLYHTGFNQVMMEKGIDVAKKIVLVC